MKIVRHSGFPGANADVPLFVVRKSQSLLQQLNFRWGDLRIRTIQQTQKMPIAESKGVATSGIIQFLILFIAWYAFNAGYNVFNAHLKVFPYPLTIGMLQLAVGLAYAIPLWILGIRAPPRLSFSDLVTLFPVAALNALGHAVTVVAMFQKGGGSFAHVIKASEPVVSVLLALLINGQVPKPLTALSLLPISYGVAYASTLGNLSVATMAKELTTTVAIFAMIGNICVALRSILRKNLTQAFKTRTNLTPQNDHAVTTIYSMLLILPFLFYFEDTSAMKLSFQSMEWKGTQNTFLFNVFVCGMCYYLYNEMQNIVLGSLGPVTTAVGNTLKRVAIFLALYFFTEGESFPWPKIVGCAIAVGGCLVYAICDSFKV
jgi:solute carrier family 35 protein E1